MELPLPNNPLAAFNGEWKDVPIYAGIKRIAGPWVKEGFDIHTEGQPHVPAEGGGLIASNHASWFDPVFLGAAIDRPLHWLAKATLFRHPVTDFFFKKAGQIKVDRVSGGNQAAVDRAVELVHEDRLVGIFPEGSRSIDGALRRGRTGLARVAVRTGVPIVPVAMNSYDVLPKHAKVPNLDQPLVVEIGEPIPVDKEPKRAKDREHCRDLTDHVMDQIGRLLEKARTRRERLILSNED